MPAALLATVLSSVAFAPAAHAAIDGDEACDGGLYSILVFDGQRWVRCMAGLEENAPWGTLTVPDVTASENTNSVTFTVSRTSKVNTIWFTYTTVDGTAKAGVDYTATSGSLRWVNELSQTITVPIADDDVHTGDRSFFLRLAPGAGGPTVTLPARDAVATITDDEPEPDPATDPDPSAGETTPGDDAPKDDAATTTQPNAPVPPVATPAAAPPAPSATPAPPSAPFARLTQARTLGSVLAGRTRLAVRCSARCTLTVTLTVPSATARALGLRTRTIGTAHGAGTGRLLLPIRLSGPAKAALRRHPRTLVATATLRDAEGAPSRTVRLTLRRPS
ncbi:MAG TPA: Calx-beta domain-containing protein [Baekduia sp.]|uniref:Calx-beta domain-containing protein n=1 Tax=Baekduia sp. TaxID=2600305 RepID=UPI002D77795F|nr:Calx-beta domain-containing protein [Baekduia sp.]HET6507550.1 Calx-beta domain-containing protein [Baekduia sp.]